MIAVDSSVVIAALAEWHEGHAESLRVVQAAPRLPAHAALEAFSVLTRLPPPVRLEPEAARAMLAEAFTEPFLTLSPKGYARVLDAAARSGIAGGAVYDAVIAATVRDAGARLVTRDLRAAATYDLFDVEVEYL